MVRAFEFLSRMVGKYSRMLITKKRLTTVFSRLDAALHFLLINFYLQASFTINAIVFGSGRI